MERTIMGLLVANNKLSCWLVSKITNTSAYHLLLIRGQPNTNSISYKTFLNNYLNSFAVS
jgi:hypothetical protein